MSEIDSEYSKNNQPTLRIGVIGHVSNGKSSLVRAITGVNTHTYSSELEKGITKFIGYANAKIFKCPNCPDPICYQAFGSNTFSPFCQNDNCSSELELKVHMSFIDCPGHNEFMETMLNGTCLMDACIIVEDPNNQVIPSPQTEEHIIAVSALNIPIKMILMNKIDTIKRSKLEKKINMMTEYLNSTPLGEIPIIPISTICKDRTQAGNNHIRMGINTDVVCKKICEIPETIPSLNDGVRMFIIRTFDINKPGIPISKLQGCVPGGSLIKGVLRPDTEIKILPGIVTNDGKNTRLSYRPLCANVVSLRSNTNILKYAIPGGLIGVQLTLDPSLNKALIGSVISTCDDDLVLEQLTVEYYTFRPLEGYDKEDYKFKAGDILSVNVNSLNIECKVLKKNRKVTEAIIEPIKQPICTQIGGRMAISKATINQKKVIGFFIVKSGLNATELNN